MKNRLFVDVVLLIFFYVFWFTMISSPAKFHSTEQWLSPESLGSYLFAYLLIRAWAWMSQSLWSMRVFLGVILVCLTALTVWWRGAGHTESIAPFIDYGMLAGGFFIGSITNWFPPAKDRPGQQQKGA